MDNETKEVSFALVKITTEQFATIESNYREDGDFKLQVNFRFGADKASRIVAVFSNFIFECNEKPFLVVEVGCHFVIKPESWEKQLNKAQNTLVVPVGLVQHLAVLTVGTTRGVLHAKTENTSFNKFFLPTVNVAEILVNDQKFLFAE
ncbi:MAG: hypothetical protein ACOX5K_08015 [Bacteroidales bacterium]|jgi:hypothetical protein